MYETKLTAAAAQLTVKDLTRRTALNWTVCKRTGDGQERIVHNK